MRRAAPLLLLLATLGAAPAAAETLSLAAYRGELESIHRRLEAGDWVGARARARGLLEDRIPVHGEEIAPDRSVLAPLAGAESAAQARRAALGLRRLVAALPAGEPGGDAPAAPDPELLKQVRERQALADLPGGGRLPEVEDGGLLAALSAFLEPVVESVRSFFLKLWEWFLNLFPEQRRQTPWGLDLTLVTALVVALALILAWLGWRVLRTRRAGPQAAPAGPAPLPPAADDDPLSREANEWERYARELAAAGRAREAVRAWYHAVLVALYRAGVLHYRKGRTNWEYVSAVPPGSAWRPLFLEMTRHFEREWYGRERSTPEALRESEEMALALLAALRERAA